MNVTEAIADRIEKLCAERNTNTKELGKAVNIPDSTMKGIFEKRTHKPTIATVKKFCDVLKITLGEFFNSPEFEQGEQ